MNDRNDVRHRAYDKKGPIVARNFNKRGFEATYCPTVEKALEPAPFPLMKSACGRT